MNLVFSAASWVACEVIGVDVDGMKRERHGIVSIQALKLSPSDIMARPWMLPLFQPTRV
ncbi:hypothetical protein [Cyanobium gracile]|uniref:Uncharacterized protein n=1 Tax=Cyanobium gracile UHCC 0281 TaxID=3110309 RepID=A0ABU5SYD9_9CYAN|nr:hypothetical protein [Cyanobium gracile]MEA5443506.1 hypothetical protein [Cyanobium gracile UHCC 0281]